VSAVGAEGVSPGKPPRFTIEVSGKRPASASSTKEAPAQFNPFADLGSVGVSGDAATSVPRETPQPDVPQKTGYGANTAAGVVEGASGLGNILADPFGNLVGKPVTTAAIAAHDFLAPYFGGKPLPDDVRRFLLEDQVEQPGTRAANAFGSAIGAPAVSDVVSNPAEPGQALIRAAVGGALATAPLAPTAAVGAAAGAVGGWLGHSAAEASPERYKDFWGLVGNLAGGVIGGGGVGLAKEGATRTAGAYNRFTQPMDRTLGARPQETPVNPETGQPFVHTETGEPITLTAGQKQLAGERLIQASGKSQQQLLDAIPLPADVQKVPGVPVTLGEATGNLGLLGHERMLEQQAGKEVGGPLNRGSFASFRAQQHIALRDAIGGLGGSDAVVPAAGEFFASRLREVRHAEEEIQSRMAETAQAKTQGLGAAPGGMSEQELGRAQQQALDLLTKPIKRAVDKLSNAIDPDGTLALSTQHVSDIGSILKGKENAGVVSRVGADTVKRMREFAEDPEAGSELHPAETKLIDVAANNFSGVRLFSKLRTLDSSLAEAQRTLRGMSGPGKESRPYVRVSMLREAVDAAMSDAAEQAVKDNPAVAQDLLDAVPSPAGSVAAPGASGVVVRPGGEKLPVQYVLREAGDLVTSHHDDLRPNPAFPDGLQPRERDRAASEQQINRIEKKGEPEALGASAALNTGAPITKNGVVIDGNGRSIALRRAYRDDNPFSKAYRKWLEDQGYDLTGMKAPVLTREITGDLPHSELVKIAEEATVGSGLKMTAAETASVDAKRLTPELLDHVRPGDIDSEANRPFVRQFIHNVSEEADRAGFWTTERGLTVDGARRIRNALLQRAYGDRDLVGALAEVGDENIKALGGALQDAAGPFAKLRAGIERGDVDPAMNITPDILEAVRLVQRARSSKVPLRDLVGQQDMAAVPRPALTDALLRGAYGDNLTGRASQGRMAELLAFYADEAMQQQAGARLFGENLSPAQIMKEAQSRGGGQAVSGGGNGAGAGAAGNEARGPGAGAAREGTPEASAGAESPDLTRPPLVENMTPEARENLKLRNRIWQQYKETFRSGAIGDVLASGVSPTGFALEESRVPARLFQRGPVGAEAADSLIKATGSPEAAVQALGDYPAFAFRRAAEVDGVIDPKKADAWIKAHSEILNKFPALRAKFSDAATATKTLQDASAAGQMRIEAYEKGEAAHYLKGGNGEPVEPMVAMRRLWASPTSGSDAAALMEQTKGNPAAADGMRRNFIDFLLDQAGVQKEAGTTGEKELGGAKLQKMIADPKNAPMIDSILGPDRREILDRTAGVMQQISRRVNATNIPGSPGTTADALAHFMSGTPKRVLMTDIMAAIVAERVYAGGIGALSAGSMGAAAVGTILAAATQKVLALRNSGLRTVDDILTQAALQPEFGRLLVKEATPLVRERIWGDVLKTIGATGAAGTVAPHKKESR
jgi:hypothetical protein